MKTLCLICREPGEDMAKRFEPTIGSVCPECHAFLLAADKTLRKFGIEGVTANPQRCKPETEKP